MASDNTTYEDYPVIREMEIRTLGRDFVSDDIYKRLERLETTLFGQVSTNSLSDRVEVLKQSVFGKSDLYSNDTSMQDNEDSLKNLLSQLEMQIFNKDFSSDSIEVRVSRLETNIFNQSSEDFPIEERIDRIAAVIKAKPSSEINKDMAQLRKYQTAEQGVTLLALILMIVAGLLF